MSVSRFFFFAGGRSRSRIQGFTLAEIMIVVALVGILAALAVPIHNRLSVRARNTRFHNELRVVTYALEVYTMEKGALPPDGGGGWPAEVVEYLPAPNRWNQPTPVGGHWSWVRDTDGIAAAVRVTGHRGGETCARDLDQVIDDGDLATGAFRGGEDHLLYVIQQ